MQVFIIKLFSRPLDCSCVIQAKLWNVSFRCKYDKSKEARRKGMLTHNRCTLGLNTIYGIMYFFSFTISTDEVTHVDEMYINRWISKGPGYIIWETWEMVTVYPLSRKYRNSWCCLLLFRKLIVFNKCVQSTWVRIFCRQKIVRLIVRKYSFCSIVCKI